MPSRLTLICHAATATTRTAAFPKDEGIETEGAGSAETITKHPGRIDQAWTAPEKRALETAEALGLFVEIEPLLRDIDLGRWAGLTLKDIENADPHGVMSWLADPAAVPHGGESVDQLLQRVSGWLGRVAHGGRRVVAVSHPAVIRAAIVAAIDAGPLSFWRIDVGPLSQVELRSNGSRWVLRSLA